MILCCVCLFVHFLFPANKLDSLSEKEKQTQEMLDKLEMKNVDQVYKQIHQIEQERQKWESLQNKESDDLNRRFQNALILGDSIAEGLLDYRIISSSHCVGVRGARSDNIDDMHDIVKRQRPSVIFLEFGMNDLEYCRGKPNLFYKRYNEQLQQLKAIAPQATLYINAILPIDQKTVSQKKAYAKYPEFNKMLKKLCQENKIKLIDNRFILENMKKKYEKDGIHPTHDYYKAWAMNMAEVAGL